MSHAPSQTKRDATALAAAAALLHAHTTDVANAAERAGTFPEAALTAIAEAGLLGIAIDEDAGGVALSYLAQAQVFAYLTEADVTTAFIASQHHASTTLMQVAQSDRLRARWLPGLAAGTLRGANGFNFLNFPPDRAPMKAVAVTGGFRLTGALPWVTEAHHSDILVAGALLPDAQQLLVAIPLRAALALSSAAISVDASMDLLALAASDTTVVRCAEYFVAEEDVILGPGLNLLKAAGRHSATFVPTAMTLGHTRHCLQLIEAVAAQKGGTAQEIATWLRNETARLDDDLTAALAASDFEAMPRLRGRGNALVARAAHLALIVGGGTGYRQDQLAQRLYREAGFFSVWSVSGAIIPETLTHLIEAPL